MITNYYDGSLEKDKTKQYKLIKRVSDNGTLFYIINQLKLIKKKKI